MNKQLWTLIFGLIFWTKGVHAWTPEFEFKTYLQDCHPQLLEWKISETRDLEKRALLIRSIIEKCTLSWQNNRPQGAAADEYSRHIELDYPSRFYTWVDSKGQSRSGQAWLQNNLQKNPAVILMCSRQCSTANNPWLRRFLLHLFETGPYDVFLIHTHSSASENPDYLYGGIHDGHEILKAAAWLQTQSEFRNRISSLQVVAQGAQAHAGLFALLYNDRNPLADDRKALHGGLNLCPQVRPSAHFSSSEEQAEFEAHLKSLERSHSDWRDWFLGLSDPQLLFNRWIDFSQQRFQRLPRLMPFQHLAPETTEQYLSASDFVNWSLGLKTPSWVLGSAADPQFPHSQHLGPLESQTKDSKKTSLRVIALNDSSSCGWAGSLGWVTEGMLWRSLLQTQSFEIWPRQNRRSIVWNLPPVALSATEQHLEQRWKVDDRGQLSLEFLIADQDGHKRIETQWVSWQLIPESLRPQQNTTALALTRKLNLRLRLMGARGPLIQSQESPQRLEWWSWHSVESY